MVHHNVVAQQALALEQQVAESIAQLTRQDSDTGSRHHVANPVAVVEHTHHTRCRGHAVACHRPPGRARQSVLLVEQRGTDEGRGGVSRRPRVSRGTVGAHLLSGVFDAIDESSHERIRHSRAGQQARPVAAPLVATEFQADHHRRTEKLGVVVNARLEVGEQLSVLLASGLGLLIDAEHGLVALDGQASHEQRYADKSHVVHELVGFDTGIRLLLEEVEVHFRARGRRSHVEGKRRLPDLTDHFNFHVGHFEREWLHVPIIVCADLDCHPYGQPCENLSNIHHTDIEVLKNFVSYSNLQVGPCL